MICGIIIYLLAALYVYMESHLDPFNMYKWPVKVFIALIWLPYLLLGLVLLGVGWVFNKLGIEL
jgi:hypothetical protein